MECHCISYGCRGAIKSKRTVFNHGERDKRLQDNLKTNQKVTLPPQESGFKFWPSESERVNLFNGSKKYVQLEIAKKVATFVDNNGHTKDSLDKSILAYKQDIHVTPNNFPASLYEAKKWIGKYLLPTDTYDCCINDCCLFRKISDSKDYSKLSKCPICNADRYIEGRKIAKKRITYIRLKEQLQKRFGEASLAKLIHAGDAQMKSPQGILRDFKDGQAWRNWFSNEGCFGDTDVAGAVPLGFSTDGLNPNKNILIQKSLWPVFLSFLAMKGKYRHVLGMGLILVSIIPGYKTAEPKSLYPLLELMVDELLELTGSTMYNAYVNAPVEIKTSILHSVCDIPATAKVYSLAGAAALRACPFCNEVGVHHKILCKTVHLSNRAYLDTDHPLRECDTRFPDHDRCYTVPPKRIDPECEKQARTDYEELQKKTHKKNQLKQSGFAGHYPFEKDPNHVRMEQSTVDTMHTPADVTETVLFTITGSIDNFEKVKRQEAEYGRIPKPRIVHSVDKSHQSTRPKPTKIQKKSKQDTPTTAPITKVVYPKAPWELSQCDIQLADKAALSIVYPPTCDLDQDTYFTKPKLLKVKMDHMLKFATENILSYCIRGLLGSDAEQTIRLFCSGLADLTRKEQHSDDLDTLESDITTLLALMERDLPVYIQNITTHLLRHIAQDIRSFGPVPGRSMFTTERTICWLSRQNHNKLHQEKTIIETYILYEWIMTLRAVGIVDPSHKEKPAFCALLNELGVSQESVLPKGNKTGTTTLKRKEVNAVLDFCNSQQLFPDKIEEFMVDNTVDTWSKLSIRGTGGPVTYHCEKTDIGKKKEGHNVCWITGKNSFKDSHTIDDYELFNFGKVITLISLSIQNKELLFARVERFNTVDYEMGDIWITERSSEGRLFFLPLCVLSMPLITAKCENNLLAVLNSHVRYLAVHARKLLLHIQSK